VEFHGGLGGNLLFLANPSSTIWLLGGNALF
jgi:hypothetical protein